MFLLTASLRVLKRAVWVGKCDPCRTRSHLVAHACLYRAEPAPGSHSRKPGSNLVQAPPCSANDAKAISDVASLQVQRQNKPQQTNAPFRSPFPATQGGGSKIFHSLASEQQNQMWQWQKHESGYLRHFNENKSGQQLALSVFESGGQLSHSLAQRVEFLLKLRHTINVGSHFVVDVLDAAVNVRDLLCHIFEIFNLSSRPYHAFRAPQTSGTSQSLSSLETNLASRSLGARFSGGPGESTFSPSVVPFDRFGSSHLNLYGAIFPPHYAPYPAVDNGRLHLLTGSLVLIEMAIMRVKHTIVFSGTPTHAGRKL